MEYELLLVSVVPKDGFDDTPSLRENQRAKIHCFRITDATIKVMEINDFFVVEDQVDSGS